MPTFTQLCVGLSERLNGTHGMTATTGKTRTSGDRPAKAHRQGSRAAQSRALNEKAHRGGLKDACRPFGPAVLRSAS
jgi:hypothetical protein